MDKNDKYVISRMFKFLATLMQAMLLKGEKQKITSHEMDKEYRSICGEIEEWVGEDV